MAKLLKKKPASKPKRPPAAPARAAARPAPKPSKLKKPARAMHVAAKSAKPLDKGKMPAVEVKAVRKVVKPLSSQKQLNHIPAMIPTPVTTDGKPRKNQAGLTSKELEMYRELLLAKRRELVGDMSSMEREALRSTSGTNLSNLPIHMADMGTDNYEQEFTLGLVEKDRQLLREINRALAKILDGTYGICEGTGKPISKPRLEAQPWAKYSIEFAREMEKGGIRR